MEPLSLQPWVAALERPDYLFRIVTYRLVRLSQSVTLYDCCAQLSKTFRARFSRGAC